MTLALGIAVSTIEIDGLGRLNITLAKQIKNNNVNVSTELHKFPIEPGADVGAACAAINTNLAQMGYPSISQEDQDSLSAIASVAWTQKVLSAWQEWLAAQNADDQEVSE